MSDVVFGVIKMGAQGDVLFRRVESVPEGANPITCKSQVVAHSATGHHHVAESVAPFLFYQHPTNPLRAYVEMKAPASINIAHHRSFDTHQTLRLRGEPGTVWEIIRQRQRTPRGWGRVID